jgi:tetratricopeptide (TPR) repeat protein
MSLQKTRVCGRSAILALALFVCHAAQLRGQQASPSPAENELSSGVQAIKAGDLDRAEKIFEAALRRGDRSPLVLHNLGVIAQGRGNHQLAVKRFREVIAAQPNYGPARLLLGSSLLVLGKNQEAITQLQRASKLMPDQPAVELELAKAYKASEQWTKAVQSLQQLADSSPDNVEYSYQLLKALTHLSGWSLQEIARLNPDSARLHQALGQEYSMQGKYDQALTAYQAAARSDPQLPEIHLGMALALLQLKRYDEALAEDELELKLVPESKIASRMKVQIEAAKANGSP